MNRRRNHYIAGIHLVTVIGALVLGGCVGLGASSPNGRNRAICVATDGGLAGMNVTAQSRQITWRVIETAEDGTQIPDASQYFFDLDKAKYSAAAKADKSPKKLFRIYGTPDPSRRISGKDPGPKIWLNNVRIELAAESQTNSAAKPLKR